MAPGRPAAEPVTFPAEAGQATIADLEHGVTYTFQLRFSKGRQRSPVAVSPPVTMPALHKELPSVTVAGDLSTVTYTGPVNAAGDADGPYGILVYGSEASGPVTYAGPIKNNRPDGEGTLTRVVSSCTGRFEGFEEVIAECRLALEPVVVTAQIAPDQYTENVEYKGGVVAKTSDPNVRLGPFQLAFEGKGLLTAAADGSAHRYEGAWDDGVLREGQIDVDPDKKTARRYVGTFDKSGAILTGRNMFAVDEGNIQVVPYTNGTAFIGIGGHAFAYEIEAGKLDDGGDPVRGLSVWSHPDPRLRVFNGGQTTIEVNHNETDDAPRFCKPTSGATVDISPWELRCAAGPQGYCIVEDRTVGIRLNVAWPPRPQAGPITQTPIIRLDVHGNKVNPSAILIDGRETAIPAADRMTQPQAYALVADLCAGNKVESGGNVSGLDNFCVASAYAFAKAINCPDITFFVP